MFITVNVSSGNDFIETLLNPQAIRSVKGVTGNKRIGAEIEFRDKSVIYVKEEFYIVRGMIQNAHRNVTEVRVS